MTSIKVRVSQRMHRPRRNNESIRRRNVCNLISVNVSKPGPPLAKVIPKCLVLNARSLAKPDAASALCTEVITNKINVCFISETWLKGRILSSLICPDGYILVRKDRSDERLGGGVAILCRNNWKINNLDFNNTVFECLWCEIHINKYNKYYVAAIYNPPDPTYPEPDLLDHLSESCEQILLSDPGARIIIAGDINHLKITDFTRQHNLDQLVKKFTRGLKTLDVFLTNRPYIWKVPTAFTSLVRSDHLAIMVAPQTLAKAEKYIPNSSAISISFLCPDMYHMDESMSC